MPHFTHHRATVTRRKALAAGGTAALAAIAGCSSAFDLIADQFLEDVNVFNDTGHPVTGTVRVTGPTGETALDRTFELTSSDDTGDDGSAVFFENVWTEAGSYELRVELHDTVIDGQSRATETITVLDPGEEMVGIPLGADDLEEPIDVRVGEDLTDWHEE